MPTEKEYIQRIRQLEVENSALQDKLDAIYAIVSPDGIEADGMEADGMEAEEERAPLINIEPPLQ